MSVSAPRANFPSACRQWQVRVHCPDILTVSFDRSTLSQVKWNKLTVFHCDGFISLPINNIRRLIYVCTYVLTSQKYIPWKFTHMVCTSYVNCMGALYGSIKLCTTEAVIELELGRGRGSLCNQTRFNSTVEPLYEEHSVDGHLSNEDTVCCLNNT